VRSALLFVLVASAPAAACADPPVVEIRAAADEATLEGMAARVRALEGRLDVSVRWIAPASIDVRDALAAGAREGLFARVWLDMSDPDRAILFLANERHDSFLVRFLPVHGYGELAQESLTTVVETAIEALLAGGDIGIDRAAAVRELDARLPSIERAPIEVEPAPPAIETPLPPLAAPRRLASAITLAYRADVISEEPAVRHGAELALSWTGFFDPSLDLLVRFSAQISAPYLLGDAAQGVSLSGGGARIAIGAMGEAASIFVWQAAIGIGVDLSNASPRIAPDSGLLAAESFVVAVPIASALVAGALRPLPWIEIAIGGGLDVDLSAHRYAIRDGDAIEIAVAPWIVHPFAFLSLGLLFDARIS
jgi:hypothetical protein